MPILVSTKLPDKFLIILKKSIFPQNINDSESTTFTNSNSMENWLCIKIVEHI